MKLARKSFGEPYGCKKDWPEDCFVQCGGRGIVLPAKSFDKVFASDEPLKVLAESASNPEAYTTAFFEAFPKSPNTFIRGEGKTIEEAEAQAWVKFEKVRECEEHEFETRGYTNGAGFCKHCNMFETDVFEPTEECCICSKKTYYTQDNENNWYCKDCRDKIPQENKTRIQLLTEEVKELEKQERQKANQ